MYPLYFSDVWFPYANECTKNSNAIRSDTYTFFVGKQPELMTAIKYDLSKIIERNIGVAKFRELIL